MKIYVVLFSWFNSGCINEINENINQIFWLPLTTFHTLFVVLAVEYILKYIKFLLQYRKCIYHPFIKAFNNVPYGLCCTGFIYRNIYLFLLHIMLLEMLQYTTRIHMLSVFSVHFNSGKTYIEVSLTMNINQLQLLTMSFRFISFFTSFLYFDIKHINA